MHDATIASDADSIAVMIDAWTLMVGRLPDARIESGDGVTAMIGNVAGPFYNFIVLDRPFDGTEALDRALAVARRHADACPYPAMLAFCSEWLPAGWAASFAAAGLSFSTDMTGMATDAMLPPRRPVAPELELRRIDGAVLATAAARLNAHGYGQPEAEVAFMEDGRLWRPEDSFGIVGLVDGTPVTTATVFLLDRVAYVALVASEPGRQGRGYAEAAMRRALDLATDAAGPRRIWLHASDAGRPLYAAMGFTAGATTPVYGFD